MIRTEQRWMRIPMSLSVALGLSLVAGSALAQESPKEEEAPQDQEALKAEAMEEMEDTEASKAKPSQELALGAKRTCDGLGARGVKCQYGYTGGPVRQGNAVGGLGVVKC